MNALTRDLIKLVDMTEEMMKEKEQKEGADYREKLHLMPPVGWLNDPNGLCQLNGIYHAFFQYSPFNAEGGVKMWGHYTSKDMIDWEYQGVKLYPDQPFDCHGVYSGSAFIEDDKMYVYYTGNVKLEDGDFDYINTGRESNTVLVVSEDGKTFGSKKELMRNVDYPSDLTCHVRDPKVWKDGDTYYMIQGARTKEDVGQALIFESKDKINWKFRSRVESEKTFGYMWECPDYFEVDGTKILSASVQGLEGGVWDDRNVYQSGYFMVDGNILDDYKLSEYMLWDYGFDFYAPQTMETEDGRRILIGWMQSWDNPIYPDTQRWSGMMSVPRELFIRDGRICQLPVRELDNYHINEVVYKDICIEESVQLDGVSGRTVDLMIGLKGNQYTKFRIKLACDGRRYSEIVYDREKDTVTFDRTYSGLRKDTLCTRRMKVSNRAGEIKLRILIDRYSVEIFVNDGEQVMTSLIYTPLDASGIYFESNGKTILDVKKYDIEVL